MRYHSRNCAPIPRHERHPPVTPSNNAPKPDTGERFDAMQKLYNDSFETYGDHPGALLTPKGRGELRYSVVPEILGPDGGRLLDYGCGLGYLFETLRALGQPVTYHGVDMMQSFVDACRNKFGSEARFDTIDPQHPLEGCYDVIFASGVFNLQSHSDPAVSKRYAFDRIADLFALTEGALICDFPSGYVDFQQDGAQHFEVGEVADICVSTLSRRFVIRHDILPYEFTLIAWKDDHITRPQNIFSVDIV